MDEINILLVNVDCKWNLALRRLYAYHENKGNTVSMVDVGFGFYKHAKRKIIDGRGFDIAYVSNIFESNSHNVEVYGCSNVQYGGIGSRNPNLKLPDEVEATPPKYFDGEDTAHGYITRGCIRNCYFCKVPKFEGKLTAYRNVAEVVGDFKKAIFHDNNILAWGGCCDSFRWLIEHGIKCQFNQGLDLRLVDERKLDLLSRLNYMGEYGFAVDDVSYIKPFESKLQLAKKYISKPWKMKFFVYVNADMEPRDTVKRIEWLRQNGCLPYIMRDQNVYGSENEQFYTDVAAYCNQPGIFKKMDFETFLRNRHPKNSARQAWSFAIWNGECPTLCESCWQPTLDLFAEDENTLCAGCVDDAARKERKQ